MTMVIGTIIAGSTLLKLVLGALVAGLGVTIAFAGVIYCVERSVAFRREHRRGAAAVFEAGSALAVAAVIALVTYGLILTMSKPK
jgi:hypothetical protein